MEKIFKKVYEHLSVKNVHLLIKHEYSLIKLPTIDTNSILCIFTK